MKACTQLTLCALWLATAGAATADPTDARRDAGLDGLPPNRILAIVRATGFDPMGWPERNGDLYVVRAIDPNDIAYRLLIDSHTGRTVSMRKIATPGPYEAAPAYARNRGPIYGWIFAPQDGGYGAPRPPRTVPHSASQPRHDTATPLPRPRPYVAEATGSIPSNSAKPAEPQTASEAQTASAPPSPASQTAPELNAAPQSKPASEPPKRNGGASMPPVAPLD